MPVMKVFLVEDSEIILERLRALLSEVDGVQAVGEARTEQDAVRGIDESRPDLVILDLTLAEGSGIAVLRHTTEALPAAKTVVLTNHIERQYRLKCLSLGAARFLDKARDFRRLRMLMRSSVRRLHRLKTCSDQA
jgi:DNA-binding NarL/FixJ family response regulator